MCSSRVLTILWHTEQNTKSARRRLSTTHLISPYLQAVSGINIIASYLSYLLRIFIHPLLDRIWDLILCIKARTQTRLLSPSYLSLPLPIPRSHSPLSLCSEFMYVFKGAKVTGFRFLLHSDSWISVVLRANKNKLPTILPLIDSSSKVYLEANPRVSSLVSEKAAFQTIKRGLIFNKLLFLVDPWCCVSFQSSISFTLFL